MSFGYSIGDAFGLGQLAWRVIQNSRKTCGEHDALTREVSAMRLVLQRLQQEAERPESPINQPSNTYGNELQVIAANCRTVLRILDKILSKYAALGEADRSARKLWQKVRFGNGEVVDLAVLRGKINSYTSAISFYLNLASMGTVGRIEQQMSNADDTMKDIQLAVNRVTSLIISRSNDEGSIFTTHADDDKSVWKELHRELIRDGIPSSIIRSHKRVIIKYIKELASRGLLDDQILDDAVEDLDDFEQRPEAPCWRTDSCSEELSSQIPKVPLRASKTYLEKAQGMKSTSSTDATPQMRLKDIEVGNRVSGSEHETSDTGAIANSVMQDHDSTEQNAHRAVSETILESDLETASSVGDDDSSEDDDDLNDDDDNDGDDDNDDDDDDYDDNYDDDNDDSDVSQPPVLANPQAKQETGQGSPTMGGAVMSPISTYAQEPSKTNDKPPLILATRLSSSNNKTEECSEDSEGSNEKARMTEPACAGHHEIADSDTQKANGQPKCHVDELGEQHLGLGAEIVSDPGIFGASDTINVVDTYKTIDALKAVDTLMSADTPEFFDAVETIDAFDTVENGSSGEINHVSSQTQTSHPNDLKYIPDAQNCYHTVREGMFLRYDHVHATYQFELLPRCEIFLSKQKAYNYDFDETINYETGRLLSRLITNDIIQQLRNIFTGSDDELVDDLRIAKDAFIEEAYILNRDLTPAMEAGPSLAILQRLWLLYYEQIASECVNAAIILTSRVIWGEPEVRWDLEMLRQFGAASGSLHSDSMLPADLQEKKLSVIDCLSQLHNDVPFCNSDIAAQRRRLLIDMDVMTRFLDTLAESPTEILDESSSRQTALAEAVVASHIRFMEHDIGVNGSELFVRF